VSANSVIEPFNNSWDVKHRSSTIESYESFLDNPPPFHQKLVGYGARPYWSPDGKRIAFVEKSFGDISEVDLETREVRSLTRGNGENHAFLRVLMLPTGDYILVGPPEYKDNYTSRWVESELWMMDKEAKHPPYKLGRRIYEGLAISQTRNRISYAVSANQVDGLTDEYEIRTADIEFVDGRGRLTNEQTIGAFNGEGSVEPQDFRHDDSEIIFANYRGFSIAPTGVKLEADWRCDTRGIVMATGERRTYIAEQNVHNECEGIFPDNEHICLESSCDFENKFPPIDLWRLRLDGSGARQRMTRAIDHAPWRTSNCNVSPDGRLLAFMVSTRTDHSGTAKGIGLLDLEAWSKSPQAQVWEYPKKLLQD